jgi:hypothetical protein
VRERIGCARWRARAHTHTHHMRARTHHMMSTQRDAHAQTTAWLHHHISIKYYQILKPQTPSNQNIKHPNPLTHTALHSPNPKCTSSASGCHPPPPTSTRTFNAPPPPSPSPPPSRGGRGGGGKLLVLWPLGMGFIYEVKLTLNPKP